MSTRCGVSAARLSCQVLKVPCGIGVDHIDRAVAGAFGFNGEMSAQACLAAAALLRVDDNGLHAGMLG